MKILEEVSKTLGTHLTNDTLEREVKILDMSGRITQRKIIELVLVIIKYLHKNETSTNI